MPCLSRNHHHRLALLLRFGRWGTCSGCPQDSDGFPRPDLCGFSERYDHNITDDRLFTDEDFAHVVEHMRGHNRYTREYGDSSDQNERKQSEGE